MAPRQWQNTVRVGKYKCHMTFKENGTLLAEWDPDLPPRGGLTKKEIRQYKNGRNALIAEVAKEIGTILVVDT